MHNKPEKLITQLRHGTENDVTQPA